MGAFLTFNMDLQEALADKLWQSHKIGDTYTMDNVSGWKIAYYPIFEDNASKKVYSEPRALVERPAIFQGKEGIDFREVPLKFLTKDSACN